MSCIVPVSYKDKTLYSYAEVLIIVAKAVCELRKMQHNQLIGLTKEELLGSILSTPETSEGLVLDLADSMKQTVSNMADPKQAITSPDIVINKRNDKLKFQVEKQTESNAKQKQYL